MDTESSQPYLLLVITLNYKKLCAQGYAITKEADKGNQRPGPGEELSNLKNFLGLAGAIVETTLQVNISLFLILTSQFTRGLSPVITPHKSPLHITPISDSIFREPTLRQ